MAKKAKSTQVAITGVAAFDTKEEYAKIRRHQRKLTPYVGAGSVYGIGLAYPQPGTLPMDECGISALTVDKDGQLFGATSGKAAHLFWMNCPLRVADIGAIPGVSAVASSLVIDGDNVVHGASSEKGGPMFIYDTEAGMLDQYRAHASAIKVSKGPFKDDGVAGLAISRDGRTIAGMAATTPRAFVMDVKTRKMKVTTPISRVGEAWSRVLCAADDGLFYGSAQDGKIFRLSPGGEMKQFDISIPSGRGKSYVASITSITLARSGLLYGGTNEGCLFSFNPATEYLVSLGRGNDIPDMHGIVEGADGTIYGVTGRGKSISHLVSYRPDRAEWTDLGILACYGHYPWRAYQIGALAVGKFGQVYAGEKDRFGHLFIYHPPVVAR